MTFTLPLCIAFVNCSTGFDDDIQAQVLVVFPVSHGVKQSCILARTLFLLLLAAVIDVAMDVAVIECVYLTSPTDGKLFNLSCF